MGLPAELMERMTTVRAQLATGQMERSKAEYALKRLPAKHLDHPSVLSLAGRLHLIVGNGAVGVASVERAFAVCPDDADITSDMAKVLWATKRQENAIAILDSHFRKFPTRTDVGGLLVYYLQLLGRTDAAAEVGERIIRDSPDATSTRLLRANRMLELRDYAGSLTEYEAALSQFPKSWPIALGLFLVELYRGAAPESLRVRTEAFCRDSFGAIRRRNPPVRPVRGRLRVGYIGATFRRHVVAHFTQGLLQAHNRDRVWVAVYSDSSPDDAITQQFRAHADAFRGIKGLPDHEVVDQILKDEIDVLVDLGGHTESSCLPILAHRPAGVQVSYVGYPATTGLADVDYRITDALADPPGMTESHYTETLWRLPRCAWAYAPFADDERFDAHLSTAEPPPSLQVGAYNVLHKAEHRALSLWGRSLASAGSDVGLKVIDRRGLRLDRPALERLLGELESAGFSRAESRLELLPPTDNALERYRRYGLIDLNLDPVTYHGTTTTCEALWYGVPTLSLAGTSHVTRVGVSLLSAVGLDSEFLANDENDFAAKLAGFARDPSRLRRLRPTLRDRLRQSPLGDAASLARVMEDAYFAMVEEQRAKRGG